MLNLLCDRDIYLRVKDFEIIMLGIIVLVDLFEFGILNFCLLLII